MENTNTAERQRILQAVGMPTNEVSGTSRPDLQAARSERRQAVKWTDQNGLQIAPNKTTVKRLVRFFEWYVIPGFDSLSDDSYMTPQQYNRGILCMSGKAAIQ